MANGFTLFSEKYARYARNSNRAAGLVLAFGMLHALGVSKKATAAEHPMFVYFGTYTGNKSHGIYVSRFDLNKGQLSSPELAAESKNPSFLALHPNGRFLYAAGEVAEFQGKLEGVVSAFELDSRTGKLALLNQASSRGSGPCHVSLDKTGRCLLVANYGSGSIAVLPVQENGRLAEASTVIQHHGSSINSQRQEGPHAHFITSEPNNRFVLACDLGLDKVLVYRLDSTRAELASNDPPSAALKPGSGPRHLAFHPNGRFVYVINEMASTVTAFDYDSARGRLKELQTVSTLPDGFKGNNSCAEIQIHPSGRFVYGSNRGHNSIAVFAVDSSTGNLKLIAHQPTQGKTPRHFALDPSARWMLVENQDSDNVHLFEVDDTTGQMKPTDKSIEVGAPVCVVFATVK